MVTVQIKCDGISPFLMNKLDDKILEYLHRKAIKQIVESKIYRENGDKGRIGIPSEMLYWCLVAAGRNVKNGKKQVSTAASSTLSHLLFIRNIFIPFTNIKGKGEGSWKVYRRRVSFCGTPILGQGHPRFDKWEFRVTVTYDETKIDEKTLRKLFENAGLTQGLGLFRPGCKGLFGRFKVVSWKVLNKKIAA